MPAILAILQDAGYDGLLALEIDYLAPAYAGEGEDAAVGASMHWLRDQVAALERDR